MWVVGGGCTQHSSPVFSSLNYTIITFFPAYLLSVWFESLFVEKVEKTTHAPEEPAFYQIEGPHHIKKILVHISLLI